jgi:Carboxypeptidase regulatory-like domain
MMAIAGMFFALFAVFSALAFPPEPLPEDNFVVRGSVVSSVDGTPVRAALVQLLGEKPRAMLTGTDGSFAFEGLAAGDAIIVVRKPGYFSAQEYFPESVGEQHVHLGPKMKDLELKLYPEAVVYGKVTNENGRPLEGFTVQLRRAGTKSSGGARGNLSSTVTNENGEYRLSELRAGTYLVSVSQRLNPDTPVALFQTANLHFGFPTHFFPGVTDAAAATPIRLTPGKQAQADLRMTSQPLYRISGTVQSAGGNGSAVVVLVGRYDIWPVAAATVMPGWNGFVLEGIPAGSYFLGAVQTTPEGREKSGIRVVEVTGNMEGVPVALGERKPIRVRFRFQPEQFAESFGARGVYVDLRRADIMADIDLIAVQLSPRQDSPDGFDIQLDPGAYRARSNVSPVGCVVSVKSGSTDMLNEDLLIGAGGSVEPIEVFVREDCGAVKGTVTKDGQPAMGRVLLIPVDAPRRGVSMAADSDGLFHFARLVPGKYYAVALDGAEDLDASDPEALGKVESRATVVDVGNSGTASITLQLRSLEP